MTDSNASDGAPEATPAADPTLNAPGAPAGSSPAEGSLPPAEGEAPRRRRRRRRGGRGRRRPVDGQPQGDLPVSEGVDAAPADADADAERADLESEDGPEEGAPVAEGAVAAEGAPAEGQQGDAPRRRRRRRRGRGRRPEGAPVDGAAPVAAEGEDPIAAEGEAPAPVSAEAPAPQAPRPPREDRPRRDHGDRPRRERDERPRREDRPRREERPEGESSYPRRGPLAPEEPEIVDEGPEFDITEPAAFAAIGIRGRVLKAVADCGYVNPSEIQARAIPVLLSGRDVIGGSQTGSGKTAAFALPIVQRLARHGHVRALILEPTRELAAQVYEQFIKFSKHTTLRVALLHGGVGYGPQRDQLAAGPDIVVATPGRLLDFLEQKAFSLSRIETLVLDEADRMLDMGFIPDVRRLVKMCPKERQSMLFSATVPPAIKDLSDWMLKDPETIQVGLSTGTASTVTHALYPVDPRQKFDLLVHLLKTTDYHSVIIFCRTKVNADVIARWLEGSGHDKLAVLHSDRPQNERTKALDDFRSGAVEVLVATDIVARGIDISTISHVINYDIPQHPEDYVHRIGRTGRMNAEGDAATLVTADESTYIRAIEKLIGRQIERRKLEGFEYTFTPLLDTKPAAPKRRNRGYTPPPGAR